MLPKEFSTSAEQAKKPIQRSELFTRFLNHTVKRLPAQTSKTTGEVVSLCQNGLPLSMKPWKDSVKKQGSSGLEKKNLWMCSPRSTDSCDEDEKTSVKSVLPDTLGLFRSLIEENCRKDILNLQNFRRLSQTHQELFKVLLMHKYNKELLPLLDNCEKTELPTQGFFIFNRLDYNEKLPLYLRMKILLKRQLREKVPLNFQVNHQELFKLICEKYFGEYCTKDGAEPKLGIDALRKSCATSVLKNTQRNWLIKMADLLRTLKSITLEEVTSLYLEKLTSRVNRLIPLLQGADQSMQIAILAKKVESGVFILPLTARELELADQKMMKRLNKNLLGISELVEQAPVKQRKTVPVISFDAGIFEDMEVTDKKEILGKRTQPLPSLVSPDSLSSSSESSNPAD